MKTSDSPGVVVPPPTLFLAALVVGLLFDGRVPYWADPRALGGAALAIAGLALGAASLGLFRRFGTRPEPWQPAAALITTGLYRFSRNPMYLGMALLSAGIALAFGSVAALVLTLLAVVAIDRFVIAREEAYLQRRFGPAYAAYRARTRRWL